MSNIAHLGDLTPDPRNARRHNPRNVGMIERALGEVGAARSIVIDENGTVLAGNATVEAAAAAGIDRVQVVDADGETIIAVRRSGLTPEQKRKLALYDNRANELSDWEPMELAADLVAGLDLSGMFSDAEMGALLKDVGAEPGAGEGEAEPEYVDVPDALFPSDNEWGVPLLDRDLQANGLVLPVNRWGTFGRKTRMAGTYHFYTDDYRFEGVWADPTPVLTSGCVALVEPNFSTNDDMPRVVVLWHIYRKRWLARFWQSFGVRIWVDLAIAPKHRDLSLLGVPKGWKAYATYTYSRDYDPQWLMADWAQAVEHAGTESILFWVYGGNESTEAMCRERGWLWTPAHQQAYFRNVRATENG